MASATYDRRPGWVTFAAVLLLAVGFSRIISAINYFSNGSAINDLSDSVFGEHLWVWGIWDLCLAASRSAPPSRCSGAADSDA